MVCVFALGVIFGGHVWQSVLIACVFIWCSFSVLCLCLIVVTVRVRVCVCVGGCFLVFFTVMFVLSCLCCYPCVS